MVKSNCKWCEKEIVRGGSKPGVFCCQKCKGAWQRTQKPVNRDWLYEKYVVEGLSTYQIAELVDRDPKSVYRWLIDWEIPTRRRKWNTQEPKAYWDRDWLYREYIEKGRSASEIAESFNCGMTNIAHYLCKFNIPTRSVSEARKLRHWGLEGEANGMFGKTGEDSPSWKGGCTPDRQDFYVSQEWKRAVRVTWKRDHAQCQRCGKRAKGRGNGDFHIHHIISFAVREFRAEPNNLILLCANCHHWIHSRENTEGEFLEGGDWDNHSSSECECKKNPAGG